jgi:cytochrome oxidase Cu insertion factor (SCO1/SenC/PrrC family)
MSCKKAVLFAIYLGQASRDCGIMGALWAATQSLTVNPYGKERYMLNVGDKAPEFTLMADDGTQVSLADYRGQKVVIYFYPKANTSG